MSHCEPWSVAESKPTASSPPPKSLVFSRQLFLRLTDIQTTLLRVGEIPRNDLSNRPLVGLIVAKETDHADLPDPFRRQRDIETRLIASDLLPLLQYSKSVAGL